MSVEIALFGRLKAEVAATKSTGVVNTNGTAVVWVSGDKFDSRWAGQPVTINGVQYAVASVATDESLTLYSTAGVQAGVTYAFYRVYGATAPQSVVKPYIVYHKLSPGREYSHDGFSKLSRSRVQISCYGETYGSAKQVAAQVIAAMESWQAGGVRFAPLAGEQDLFEQDTGLYHVPVDFFVHFEH